MSQVFSSFAKLNPSDIDWMIAAGKQEEIPVDKVLMQEGQPIEALYFLLNGTLTMSVSEQGDAEVRKEIGRLSKGDLLGEISFVDNYLPSVTVKALEKSQILSVPKRELLAQLEQNLGFAGRFYQMLSIKLSSRLRNLSDLLARSKIVPGQPLRKVLFVFAVLNDSDIDWLIPRESKKKFLLIRC